MQDYISRIDPDVALQTVVQAMPSFRISKRFNSIFFPEHKARSVLCVPSLAHTGNITWLFEQRYGGGMSRGIPFGELPEYPGPLCMGMKGEGVELFQEMMNLLGFQLTVDGEFAQATRSALYAMTGKEVLEEKIWHILLKPIEHALNEIPAKDSIAVTALAYAKKHLRAGATALPGRVGPWVRLYNQGYDGPDYYWPAGFIYFCLAQAHNSFSTIPKGDRFAAVPFTLNCDEIGQWAKDAELLITDHEGLVIPPGSLFLEGAADFDMESNPHYTHVGFVDEFYGESFTSVEGNVNDKVIAKYRAFGVRAIHFVSPQPE